MALLHGGSAKQAISACCRLERHYCGRLLRRADIIGGFGTGIRVYVIMSSSVDETTISPVASAIDKA